MAVHLHHRDRQPAEKIRLPLSGRIIGFAIAGILAVAAGLFSVFYFAFDAADRPDPTAEGFLPEELVPSYLEDYIRTYD